MKAKVTVCTLCASSAQGAAERLAQRLAALCNSPESRDYGDTASFASGIAACAEQGGIVIAAAPVSLFLNAKLRVLKSISSKIVRSSAIISAMGAAAPENSKERDLQAAIPEKAKPILTADGLYSAFIQKDGKALTVFLPLDEERLDYIFSTELDRLFAGLQAPKAEPAPAPVPAAKPEKAKSSGFAELKEHIKEVIDSGKTVAVSPCGCAKPLLSAITAVPGCETAFVPDSAMRDRQPDESIENYAAECAKISKENAGTDFGASISAIYGDRNGGEDFVIVCVADSERAKAAKVFAEPGEDKKQLIVAAVIKLCEMLDEISENGLVNPALAANEPVKHKKNSTLPIIIAAACVAVAVIVCVVLAFVLGKDDQSANLTYAGNNDYISEEENTFGENIDYYGGSGLEFDDSDAVEITTQISAVIPVAAEKISTETASVISTVKTAAKTTAAAVLTTVKNAATTVKATAAATTAKVTAAPTTVHTTVKTQTTKKNVTVNPGVTAEAGKNDATVSSGSAGTFVFRVYGWGHGVGMSQEGAIKMAKDGSGYEQILTHYFTGTKIKADSETPATVKYGDKDIPLVEYLCRTTVREIGPSAPAEALKAQIVAVYTYAKWYGFDVKKSLHAYNDSYEYVGKPVYEACLDVLSMSSETDTPHAKYVDYNGRAAFTCYFASAAGKTASADSVWGGGDEKYPYLKGGVASPETVETSTVEISAEEMKKLIEEYAKDNNKNIVLGSNPADWLEIISHDSSYSKNIGYVTKIRIGNFQLKGNAFRCYVADFKLRSHCFTFEFIPAPVQETHTNASTTAAPAKESAAV